MNAFEINKIVGAVLMTAVIVSVTSIAGNILVPEGGSGGEHGQAESTAGHGGQTGKTETTVKKPIPEIPLATLLAQGSVEAGKKAVKKCIACHSFNQGGANKIGPNLYAIIGRSKGAHPGYKYSSAMKGAGGVWSFEHLFKFLKKPGAFVKGTKMSFRIKKPNSRADLLLYLRTLAESPVPLPQPSPASSTGGQPKEAAEKPKQTAKSSEKPAAGAATTAGDAARGAKLAGRICKVCHTLKSGGSNKVGPNLYGVVGRARASHPGFNYSSAMKAKGGTWTPAELNTFLTNPGKFVKGTKMPIKISKPDQRADIIAYLKTLTGN